MEEQLASIGNVIDAMHADEVLTPVEAAIIKQRMKRIAGPEWTLPDLMQTLFSGIPVHKFEHARVQMELATATPAAALTEDAFVTRRMVCKALRHEGFPNKDMRRALRILKYEQGFRLPTPKAPPRRMGPLHRKGKIPSMTVKYCPDNMVFVLAPLGRNLFPGRPDLVAEFMNIIWKYHEVPEDRRAIEAFCRERALAPKPVEA